jgi:membrane-associated phospholipid phosphatase
MGSQTASIGGQPATAEELARHRRGQRRGRALLAAALLALLGFAALLGLVMLGDPTGFDRRVTVALQRLDFPGVTGLMLAVSWPGYTGRLIVVGALVAGWLFWRRLPLEGGFALLALLVAWLYSPLKWLAGRPRPAAIAGDIRVYSHLEGGGFPSGHVVAYVVLGGLLAYLAYTLVTQAALRRALLALLAGLIALVGPSRVYLGHHWFIDVLASYLLGTALLIGLLTLYRWAKARQLAAASP